MHYSVMQFCNILHLQPVEYKMRSVNRQVKVPRIVVRVAGVGDVGVGVDGIVGIVGVIADKISFGQEYLNIRLAN